MLSKSATLLLGLIDQHPLNAYELIKTLDYMNIKYWYNIGNSTVYATIKTLEKKEWISGKTVKDGNMPDKTVYTITKRGKEELLNTLRASFCQFDYDTNIFSITAFFLDRFPRAEQQDLLEKRLTILNGYLSGIEKQDTKQWREKVSPYHVANLWRMSAIVAAEIKGTQELLEACRMSQE